MKIEAYWTKNRYTGKGNPPQEITSSSDVISTVATNPHDISDTNATLAINNVKLSLALTKQVLNTQCNNVIN
jgi:hypothetical protein